MAIRKKFNFKGNNDTSEDMVISIIKQIRDGNQSLREGLISQYKPFILRVTSIATGGFIITQHSDEYSIALAAFNEAIDTFNTGKRSGFFSYAEEEIQKHIADYMKISKTEKESSSSGGGVNESASPEKDIKDFSRVTDEKDAAPGEEIKDFSRVTDIKDFSRVTDEKDAAPGEEIKDFSRVTDIKNFSRVTDEKDAAPGEEIKDFSRVTDIKNFSRVTDEKDAAPGEEIKDFSRVTDIKNFSRVTDKKAVAPKGELRNFSRITSIRNFSRVAAIAASVAIVFMIVQFSNLGKKTNSEFAYVDVDINPSIEFVIDKDYKVVKTIFINEDAKKVFNGQEVGNVLLSAAISDFISKAKAQGYTSEDPDKNIILISAALNKDSKAYTEDQNREEKKLDTLTGSLNQDVKEINNGDIKEKTVKLTPAERESALKTDISMGRYYLYLKAEEKGIYISKDEIRDGKISDIFEKLESQSQTSVQTPEVSVIPEASVTPEVSVKPSPDKDNEMSVEQIAAFSESTVIVTAYNKNKQAISQGSGFCIAPGLFVTNFHVIEAGLSIKITTDNGTVLGVEGIVKSDKGRDLAVLKTVKNPGIKALRIGSKNSLSKGDKVVAIGSPQGLRNSISEGIVSGFRKEGSIDVIQTTVTLANGSSGGPLFDMHGNVVGINSYGVTDYKLNFAIPADDIRGWQNELTKISFQDVRVVRKLVTDDTDIELKIVIYDILSALENENINSYFNNMTKELYSVKTKENLEVLFKNYDLIYNPEGITVLSKNTGEAELQYVYTIYKIKGPEFNNCRITGNCTLKKTDKGWKISKSKEEMKYLK